MSTENLLGGTKSRSNAAEIIDDQSVNFFFLGGGGGEGGEGV